MLKHAARAAAEQLSSFSATSGGRAWRAQRALVRATRLSSQHDAHVRAARNSDRSRKGARYSDQSPSRAATRGALFSCFAAARAACVSTWLGEGRTCSAMRAKCSLAGRLTNNALVEPVRR